MTTPYTAEMIAPSLREAEALAARLAKLPEVSQAITAASFIPAEQEQKLAILADLQLLIGPTLSPEATLPPPTDDEIASGDGRFAQRAAAGRSPRAATVGPRESRRLRLAACSRRAPRRAAPAIIPALQQDLLTGLEQRLDVAAPRHRRQAGDPRRPAARIAGQLDHPGRPGPGRSLSEGRRARPRGAAAVRRGGAHGRART